MNPKGTFKESFEFTLGDPNEMETIDKSENVSWIYSFKSLEDKINAIKNNEILNTK